ncbi:MAG: HlyD family efflux transporter periplasmic adaptor subunit [Anaerolineae bacterium]|nr:MAG: HlyD family efflux transporter periplasmic adaptor subunit [Anaerolineae bacterium]
MRYVPMKKTLLLILLLGLLLSACGTQPEPTPVPQVEPVAPDAVVAEGHVVPRREVTLSFLARGRVAEILVSEGDAVSAGDVIARLGDSEQAQAAMQAANLELASARQAYNEFLRSADIALAQAWQDYMDAQVARAQAEQAWEAVDEDAIQDRIDEAVANVNDRRSDLTDAQDTFDRYKDLDRNNPSRQQAKDDLRTAQINYNAAVRELEAIQRERDAARAALDAAIAAEAEAKRKYEDLMNNSGLDPDQQAVLEARLANAEAQVAAAEKALADYELRAPFAGVVTDLNLEIGQLVGPETWAARLADFSTWYVETSDLTELEVVKIAVGQAVEITPDALPDQVLNGEVERIAQSFRTQAGDILYTVRIRLLDSDPLLRWGMTVEAVFQP